MTARWLAALAISIAMVGLLTALAYRSAANGAFALVGVLILLAAAVGVAWASSRRASGRG